MGMKKLTGSQENYLECLYRISGHGPVRVRDLARNLGVRLPSVTRAVSGLEKMGLVDHESYGQVLLTAEGEAVGKEIVRRHECLSRLMVELMGMSESEAAPHIHRLEHVVEESLLVRLETLADFCLDSPAWVKRLQHRVSLKLQENAPTPTPFHVGGISIHRGNPREL